jgi:hypothetical protein
VRRGGEPSVRLALGQQLLIKSRPIARKPTLRIPTMLSAQEIREFRITVEQLVAARMAVIGEEVAAAVFDGAVDEPAELLSRARAAERVVIDVEIEYHAGVVVLGPF